MCLLLAKCHLVAIEFDCFPPLRTKLVLVGYTGRRTFCHDSSIGELQIVLLFCQKLSLHFIIIMLC